MYDANFDKPKLMYHPKRVADWLARGVTSGPIYTELELTTRCNQACVFCGVDHIVNKDISNIDPALAERIVDQLCGIGNKSIMICGHGEPLLHPFAQRIVAYASARSSVSVTTNGEALDEKRLDLIDRLEWLRFSVNGCNPESYAKIHGVSKDAFPQVMANISRAVARKKRLGLKVTIGTQLVLLAENAKGVVDLAARFKEMGVDYFSVKPYSQHPKSRCRLDVNYESFYEMEDRLRKLQDDSFKIIFRARSMAQADKEKPYGKCYGTHFMNFISATGEVWECNVFAGDPRFRIGNIHKESMAEIWNGELRRKVLTFIDKNLSQEECRRECRMNACNNYLWRLKNPRDHDNFI